MSHCPRFFSQRESTDFWEKELFWDTLVSIYMKIIISFLLGEGVMEVMIVATVLCQRRSRHDDHVII